MFCLTLVPFFFFFFFKKEVVVGLAVFCCFFGGEGWLCFGLFWLHWFFIFVPELFLVAAGRGSRVHRPQ